MLTGTRGMGLDKLVVLVWMFVLEYGQVYSRVNTRVRTLAMT